MTIQDLGSIGELVGAVATVATLAYLAIQIRSNTNAVRSAAAQSVHEAFATWYRMIAADEGLAEVNAKGLRDWSELTEVERARCVATFMAILLCGQDAHIKWREGELAPELWTGWEYVMQNLLLAPGGKVFWKERGYLFGDAFRSYVDDDVMHRDAHPDAKPLGAFPIGSPAP